MDHHVGIFYQRRQNLKLASIGQIRSKDAARFREAFFGFSLVPDQDRHAVIFSGQAANQFLADKACRSRDQNIHFSVLRNRQTINDTFGGAALSWMQGATTMV